MRYNITNIAVNENSVRDTISTCNADVFARIESLMKEEDFDQADINFCLELIEKHFLTNSNADNPFADEDQFHAYRWLLESLGERIEIPSLESVNNWGFLEATGIWPMMSKQQPPFRFPKSEHAPPKVGYVSVALFQGLNSDELVVELQKLALTPKGTRNDEYETSFAQNEFAEVLESIAIDGMDLVSIVTY